MVFPRLTAFAICAAVVLQAVMVVQGAFALDEDGFDEDMLSANAYETEFRSLRADTSFGLFATPIDESFNLRSSVGTGPFGTAVKPYVFAGLANIGGMAAAAESADVPVTAGLYVPGPLPYSVGFIGQSSLSTPPDLDQREVRDVISTQTETVDSQEYEWDQTIRDVTFKRRTAYSLDTRLQTLLGLGPVTVGLDFSYERRLGDTENSLDWLQRNRTVLDTVYAERASDPPPAQEEPNFTITRSASFPEEENRFEVGTALQFDAFGMRHIVRPTFRYRDQDLSGSRSTAFSEPSFGVNLEEDLDQDAFDGEFNVQLPEQSGDVGTFEVDESLERTDTGAGIGGALVYVADQLAAFGAGSRSALGYFLAGGVDYALTDEDFSERSEEVSYQIDASGDGADFSPISRDVRSVTRKRSGRWRISGGGGFTTRTLIRVSSQVRAAIGTDLGLRYLRDPAYENSTAVDTEIEVTADYGASLDEEDLNERVTVTTDYQRDDYDHNTSYTVRFGIPSAVELRGTNWPFALVLGARSTVDYSYERRVRYPVKEKRSTVTEDGTGSSTENDAGVVWASEFDETQVTPSHDFVFRNETRLGLSIFLPGEAELDIVLNGAELFELDKLTLQAVFPLTASRRGGDAQAPAEASE